MATVLLVDDSLTVRMDLSEAFSGAGFEVIPAGSVAEARAALQNHEVQVAVLDVLLPDGDGISVLEDIRKRTRDHDLPVILLSTEAEVKDRLRGLQRGADDYIGKPYDAAQLVTRVKQLLGKREGAPAPTPPTILVIDDSVTFREALSGALSEAGYGVITAPGGIPGLKLMALRRPQAVIVDGVMPDLDGPSVIRRVRLDEALRGTPCMLLTGSEETASEIAALDAGADAFARKEEDMEVVLMRLQAMIRNSSDSAEGPDPLLQLRRVLLVDHRTDAIHKVSELLRGEGYDVAPARSGSEALEMLAAQPGQAILVSASLRSEGFDGFETCRRIKASSVQRDMPLLMLSDKGREEMLECLAAGADDFVAMSEGDEILLGRLSAQLRRKQFEDERRRIREELLRRELEAAEENAKRRVAEARASLVEELERKNDELEAFSYSVSHDLRAPLRSIEGFSRIVLDEYASRLDDVGVSYLKRVVKGAETMGELIDALLGLARLGRESMTRTEVDLTAMATEIGDELQRREPGRAVTLVVKPNMVIDADRKLMHAVLTNLMGNAWKFSGHTASARVEVGSDLHQGSRRYFVKDNGAGFDMQYANKLFAPFQRLHKQSEFPGTGIGLATVQRIVSRHGGQVWAEGALGKGASMFFTVD